MLDPVLAAVWGGGGCHFVYSSTKIAADECNCTPPLPHLVLPGLPAGCGAWRETPVTCKPPSSSVFGAFTADINFSRKRSAATSNLPITSHVLLGCLLQTPTGWVGLEELAWGGWRAPRVNLRNLAALRFQGHLESQEGEV